MKIMLSYARADAAGHADLLRTHLESARQQTWIDRHDLEVGLTWRTEVEKTILGVDAFVLLISPEALASKEVRFEWELALRLRKHFIPIVVVPVPQGIPPELKTRTYRDLTGDYAGALAQVIGDITAVSQSVALALGALRRGDNLPNSSLPGVFLPLVERLERLSHIHNTTTGIVQPPEVFLAFVELIRSLVRDSATRALPELLIELQSGHYRTSDQGEVYLRHQQFFTEMLGRHLPAAAGEPLSIVMVVMTRAEADALVSGEAFDGRSDELRMHFDRLRADLERKHGITDWAQRYKDTPDEWQPYAAAPGSDTIGDIIRQQLGQLGANPKALVPRFIDIRTLNSREHRQQLLELRYRGCVVLVDVVSLCHPAIHDEYRKAMLDCQERTLAVQLSPFDWPDFNELVLNVRQRLDVEFWNRHSLDHDDNWRQIPLPKRVELEKYIRNVMPNVLPPDKRPSQGSGITTYIFNK